MRKSDEKNVNISKNNHFFLKMRAVKEDKTIKEVLDLILRKEFGVEMGMGKTGGVESD